MRFKVAVAVIAVLVCFGSLAAEEVKGKIKTLNPANGKVVLTVDGKDQNYLVSRATKFVDNAGKDLQNGIDSKDLAPGAEVTLTYDKKGKRNSAAKEVKVSKK